MSSIRNRKLLFLSALIIIFVVMQTSSMQTMAMSPLGVNPLGIVLTPNSGPIGQSVTITQAIGSNFSNTDTASCSIQFSSTTTSYSIDTGSGLVGSCAIDLTTKELVNTHFVVPSTIPTNEINGNFLVTVKGSTDSVGALFKVTGGTGTGAFSISLYPSVWQCGTPEQLTVTGLPGQYWGHQLQFQFIQQGTGAGYQTRTFYTLPETQSVFYDSNQHTIWISQDALNGQDFSLMPQVIVQVVDTSAATVNTPAPIILTYNAYAAGLMMFQCNQVFTSNNNYNTNTALSSTTQILSVVSTTTSIATQFMQSTVTNPAIQVGVTSTNVVTSVAVSTSTTTVSGFSALDWGFLAGIVAALGIIFVLTIFVLRKRFGRIMSSGPGVGSGPAWPSEPAQVAGKVWSVQQRENFDIQFAAGKINEEMLNDALSTGLLSQAEHLYYMNLLKSPPPSPAPVASSPSPTPVVPTPVLGPVKSAKRKK